MTDLTPHRITRPDPLTAIMLVLLSEIMSMIVLIWLDRFKTGELVLTETGCQALAVHGIESKALPDSNLCRIRAQYELSN